MPALFVFLASLLFASTTFAQSDRYSDSDIRDSIIGKRIYLAAPLGGEFPLNYRSSGTVDGTGEALGLGRFAKPKDTGKWWIDSNRLCQQFKTWYDGKPMCFELYRTGNDTLKWIRDNGQTGTARIGQSL
jgi:hypothetical protein